MAAPVTVPVVRPWLVPLRTRVRTAAAPELRPFPAPCATYRLQLRPGFGFAEVRRLAPFLERIGVSHVYLSPVFAARAGSLHGYDVIDPLRLNPELGGAGEFEAMAAELKRRGMGVILDIVPNHMAATAENPWWEDVLEEGRRSTFAGHFDIHWEAAPPGCAGRLVLPVLGAPWGTVLENGEIRVALDERGLALRYWEHRFPLSLRSYRTVLSRRPAASVRDLLGRIERLDWGAASRSRLIEKRALKAQLWRLCRTDESVRRSIDRSLAELNGRPGRIRSFEPLNQLLSEQAYVLRYWLTGRNDVNYRRFFDINELAAVRVEDEDVFEETHALIFRLIREGTIAGLRIDHVDGLYDPAGYLERLEESLRQDGAKPYVVVEKILLDGEKLAGGWRACGTTGYDFLNAADALFVDASRLPRLGGIYAGFTGIHEGFKPLAIEQKKRIVRHLFQPELERLARELHALAAGDRQACDADAREFAAAIEDATAQLPVYRTYVRSGDVVEQDRKAIETATFPRTPALSGPAGRFLRRVLLLRAPDWFPDSERDAWLRFTMRWQQFTGPVMAKGTEDTACYIYNRLVSLNTVGGDVRPVSVEEFHRFNAGRAEACPLTMNATSTHDSKRSEDVSARISVLSEVPELWARSVARWGEWNAPHKRVLAGGPAPSANDEFLLYQVLLGAWPFCPDEVPGFRERLRGFLVKAAREAKTHTDWLAPNAEYEQALIDFADALLCEEPGNRFLPDFLAVQEKLAPYGAVSSLAKALLKIACPGVPDIYQGTLLWDFSLVDPDNRRPVDFAGHIQAFETVAREGARDRGALIEDLLANWRDGRVKLYTIARALAHRRERLDLFLSGSYTPLDVSGPAANHVLAFARCAGERRSVVIVPRLLVSLCSGSDPFSTPARWLGTEVRPPASGGWRNVFTGAVYQGGSLEVAQALDRFPVALLAGS